MSNQEKIKISCSNCGLRALCMPLGLNPEELAKIDELVATRYRIKRGSMLFKYGKSFSSLYAIRTGFFKTQITANDGRDQVIGFQMAGDILGLDGIVHTFHTCDAIALEDAEVCVMPFERLEDFCREVPALQQHLHRIMSREIIREHKINAVAGTKAR